MIFSLLLMIITPLAHASIRAVAITPEVAWLIQRVGGKNVEVKSLAPASGNYHFLDARPDFILAVSRADLVCRVGLELEIGWLPKVLERAANAKVMSGGAGDCDLSRAFTTLEVPTKSVDRSMGDAHAGGNPHFWFSPLEMANAAREVEQKLRAISPEHQSEFSANRAELENELRALHTRLKKKIDLLSNKSAYQYHRDFTYFFAAYDLRSLGSIEEIPGVAPSAARLGQVALEAKKANAGIALASAQDPAATLDKFSEISGIKVVKVPASLGDFLDPAAYEKWQENLVNAVTGK